MNLNDISVIRSLKEKEQNGSYSEEKPIGSEARFVDMPSGYSLNTEIIMGQPAKTNISTEDGVTTIEQSFTPKKENGDFFSKTITITKGSSITEIIEQLFVNQYSEAGYEKTLAQTKTTAIEGSSIEEKIEINGGE